jgi:prevent-host-death family protein
MIAEPPSRPRAGAPTDFVAMTSPLVVRYRRAPPSGPIRDQATSPQSATFVYMVTVGIAELRQNLSEYLRRVQRGERLVVTDRNRPVAELGPPPATGDALDRLIAEGRVSRPLRRGLPEPLELDGDARALSTALDEIRGDR